MAKNKLYLVATPIGNLEDISSRAQETLLNVDIIAAEDTRHSRKLLDHLGIQKPLIALHDHNEHAKIEQVIRWLHEGKAVALISDAGTPLICDPGYSLVKTCYEHNLEVAPIPGPCALVAALCASGLPTDAFVFEGFLPTKSGARIERLQVLSAQPRTLVFYESPHRIEVLLEALTTILPNRPVVLARELTKRFETFLRGTAAELLTSLRTDGHQKKGEFVVMVGGAEKKQEPLLSLEDQRVLNLLLEELSIKKAAQLAGAITGKPKKLFYQWALSQKA